MLIYEEITNPALKEHIDRVGKLFITMNNIEQQICYHGTNLNSAVKYLKTATVELSICGDFNAKNYRDLWLGDGFYVFNNDFDAFKWIVQQYYKKSAKKFKLEDLNTSYKILEIHLIYDINRLFDLTKPECMCVFHTVLKSLIDKTVPDIIIPDGKIPDSVVLNYMFRYMHYGEQFDVIYAVYTFNRKNFQDIKKLQLGYVLQCQYCIKNTDIISDVKEFNFDKKFDNYQIIWAALFPGSLPLGNEPKKKYSINRRRPYGT